MKKLICLLGHNKHIMQIKQCTKEDFENEDRAITIYKCKYCDSDVLVVTRHVNAKIKECYFDKVEN